MSGDHLPSRDPAIRGDPIAPYDCEWVPNKEARVNETASTVTSDFLILFRKNFHFPNDVVTIVPKRSDRASLPPPGYLTISETNLRARLCFPPPAELIKILRPCRVNLSQFSFRAMPSIAFKTIIQDHVQEVRDHIYDIKVKALEQQCIENGFIRGFLKGVRLIQRKTGVQVEGVTPSQASDDFPSGSDGNEIESELQKAFDLDVDDETANIE
ncbi:hypothetical protein IEQ34_000548 [Dendrobium chrysotoxum]|uniref:Uncharacterized protein n=1 Tax=Dendrobium chrysotoxum TaxID=161865 RepID=A0AAV7HUF4_DENCH|nr:hypothetical protein IEQ34_000548 [Dendrobium chrysotoxum]